MLAAEEGNAQRIVSMSSSSEFTVGGRFAGCEKSAVKGPERSNFSQMCGMLSQYLKEKGSFGDLSLEMTSSLQGPTAVSGASEAFLAAPATTTMNLFPVKPKSGETSACRGLKSMDLFPQKAGLEAVSISNSGEVESTAQMTIFYGGQVLVFNDFPADKAKEVILLATISSQFSTVAADSDHIDHRLLPAQPPTSTLVAQLPPHPQPIACDPPIARKVSLQRFLAKRKDRIATRGPYDKSATVASVAPSKPGGESKSCWLGLGAQSSAVA